MMMARLRLYPNSIDLLHGFEFLLAQLWQMADEEHQGPIFFVPAAPSRHPGEAYTIFDDVEDFAIREILGLRFP